ncbi:hypothetical protein [Propionivibrio sp.]|uniref:hypothetical protein n=1 Tax=Propionivibrio sp. TaxID=2212460 RepID=UPI003BF1C983
MNLIQKWFEQIAGVSQEERHRWALAQEVFKTPHLNISALQKPACWRRKSRATALKRQVQAGFLS